MLLCACATLIFRQHCKQETMYLSFHFIFMTKDLYAVQEKSCRHAACYYTSLIFRVDLRERDKLCNLHVNLNANRYRVTYTLDTEHKYFWSFET